MSNKHQDIEIASGTAKTVNIGHGNFVLTSRVVAILESGSLPMKRLRERACEQNLLVDATAGRRMRSLIVTDSHHVVSFRPWSQYASRTAARNSQCNRSRATGVGGRRVCLLKVKLRVLLNLESVHALLLSPLPAELEKQRSVIC